MTYCSIEEAWGTSFTNSDNFQENKSLPNELANEYQSINEYQPVSYSNNDINFNVKNEKKKKIKRKNHKNYSRNMNRLSQHTGPSNRYTNNKETTKINFTNNINSNRYPTKKRVVDSSPNYLNLEAPINQYNYNMENSIIQEQISDSDKNYRNIIDNDSYYEEENNLNIPEPIESEYEENDSLTQGQSESIQSEDNSYKNNIDKSIDYLMNSKGKRKSSFFDIVLFISIGIFIIFILDIFTKLGQNS